MTIISLRDGSNECRPLNCNECPYRQEHIKVHRRVGRLSLHNAVALWDGRDLGLTYVELQVVEKLVHAGGDYVTYRHIYDVMKGREGFVAGCGPDGYKTNVRSAIKRMRR